MSSQPAALEAPATPPYERFVSACRARRIQPSLHPAPQRPLVTIVVLNFNGEAVLERCLECLLAQSYPNFEVVVADDGSTDGSRAILARYAGAVRSVLLPDNHGIARARELAVAHAKGELLAFIDNDGYASRDWLDQAVAALVMNVDVGAVASTVLLADSPALLNGAGGGMNFWCEAGDNGFCEPYEWSAIAAEALYPMGCGMLIRRALWEQIGPLDTRLRRWYDDVEIGIRVWLMGARVVTAPAALIDHDLHSSYRPLQRSRTLTARFKRPFDFEIARIRTAIKYLSRSELLEWTRADLARTVRESSSAEWRSGVIRAAAWCWNVAHIRSAWRIRTRALRNAKGDPLARFRLRTRSKFPPSRAPLVRPSFPDRAAVTPHYGVYPRSTQGCALDPLAAFLIRIESAARGISLDLLALKGQIGVRLRAWDAPEVWVHECSGESEGAIVLSVPLVAGFYELLLDSRLAEGVVLRAITVQDADAH